MKRSWRRRGKFVPPRTSLAGREEVIQKQAATSSPVPVLPKKRKTGPKVHQPRAAPKSVEAEVSLSPDPLKSSSGSTQKVRPEPALTEPALPEPALPEPALSEPALAKANGGSGNDEARSLLGSQISARADLRGSIGGSQLINFASQSSLNGSQSVQLVGQNASSGLHKYGVPFAFCNAYKRACNITEVFQWQAECLSKQQVLDGSRNLVYRGPTAAGKSLVAEILLLLRMSEAQAEGRHPLVLFVAPYKSIVSEKTHFLHQILQPHFVVKGYSSDTSNSIAGIKKTNLAVCTVEKASSILNFLISSSQENRLVAVVFDEIHTTCERFPGELELTFAFTH